MSEPVERSTLLTVALLVVLVLALVQIILLGLFLTLFALTPV